MYPELNKKSSILTLDGEEWRGVKGYEKYYQVSNFGRVKRLHRVQMNSNQVCEFPVVYKEIVMKANNDSKGYPQVTLSFPERRVARVHRLVAEVFLECPPQDIIDECAAVGLDYVMINHKDENPENARAVNLEWCTPSFNNSYGKSRKGNPKSSGEASVLAKLTEDDVLSILELLRCGKMSQEKIAAKFGVKQITISNIWTGRSWSHFTGIAWKKRSKMKIMRGCARLSDQRLSA